MASITASAPESPASSRTGRSSALTMPCVTVPTRPSGEPMAITASPTARLVRRSDRRHHGVRDVDLDDGQVRLRVAADDACGSARAVGEDGVQPAAGPDRGRRDDVVVGEHVAVALDHDPGPGAGLLADPDLQGHDGGDRARGDVGHRPGRPLLALGDGGQRGAGLGEPRGAVRRQPPDEAAGGTRRGARPARGAPAPAAAPGGRTGPRAGSAGHPRPADPGLRPRRRPAAGRAWRCCRGCATGRRRPTRAPDRPARLAGPAPGGRCNVTPFPEGRPKASASAAGGGAVDSVPPGSGGRTAPENAPDTPSGRPKAAADSAIDGGAVQRAGRQRGASSRSTPARRAAAGRPHPGIAVRLAHHHSACLSSGEVRVAEPSPERAG